MLNPSFEPQCHNLFVVEGLKCCEDCFRCDKEVSKCCWKNDANRLAQCRVAANLQFVKKKEKQCLCGALKQKLNKMRYACK